MILLLCFAQVDSYPVWVNAKKMFDLKSAEAEALLNKKNNRWQRYLRELEYMHKKRIIQTQLACEN